MVHYQNTDVSLDISVKSADVRVDPTTVHLLITTPSGTPLSYTYGVHTEIVRTDVGNYSFKLNLSAVGTYSYVWTVSGNVNGTKSGTVVVTYPPRNVTINAQNVVGATSVSEARIEVKKNGQVVGAGMSNVNGAFVLPLEAGTYVVTAYKAGWSFTAVQIVVLGTQPPGSESFTVIGSNLNITLTPPSTCRLFGQTVGGVSTKVLVKTEEGKLPGGTAQVRNNVFANEVELSVVTNSAGYWETNVYVGSRVTVTIPSNNFRRTFLVPNKSVLNIADAVAEITERSP